MRGHRKWAFPFVVVGMNSIAIYWTQAVFDFGLIVTVFTNEFNDNLGVYKPLFLTASSLTVKWLVLYALYRKHIFIKV